MRVEKGMVLLTYPSVPYEELHQKVSLSSPGEEFGEAISKPLLQDRGRKGFLSTVLW